MCSEQQQRRDDEMAAIKKIETKKQQRNLAYWKGVKAKQLKYVCIKFQLNWWYAT